MEIHEKEQKQQQEKEEETHEEEKEEERGDEEKGQCQCCIRQDPEAKIPELSATTLWSRP